MPSLDTNVLVRFLVRDDPEQHDRAKALVSAAAARRLFIPLTVLLETEWVLRSRYGIDRASFVRILTGLLETRELDFQEEASVEGALSFYGEAKAGFADCLHLALSLAHERGPLMTFDRKAARLPGAEIVPD